MKVSPHQVRFLQEIARHGVEFAVGHWALGNTVLRADQIERFTDDPDQFVADQMGVTKEQLIAWGEFSKEWQCLGITKSKARCKALASDGHRVSSPTQFNPSNPDCYCSKHKPAQNVSKLYR